jgi:hypothetical protein
MAQQKGRLIYGPGEQYTLHGLPLREGDPMDILVGSTWIACHIYYEASDGNWYCDAGLMSIPLYDGREARFRLELVPQEQDNEEDLMLAALGDLGEVYEEDAWGTEEFEDEER